MSGTGRVYEWRRSGKMVYSMSGAGVVKWYVV